MVMAISFYLTSMWITEEFSVSVIDNSALSRTERAELAKLIISAGFSFSHTLWRSLVKINSVRKAVLINKQKAGLWRISRDCSKTCDVKTSY